MNTVWWIIVITFLAGVVGTGIGGFAGAVLKRDSSKAVSLLLAFAAGVMLAVVCFDLLPQAILPEGAEEPVALWLPIVGTVVGFGLVALLNLWIDRRTNPQVRHVDENHPKTADALDELIHADHYHKHKEEGRSKDLFVAGLVMAFAIALHNMPEGMVIGASFAADVSDLAGRSGLIIAIVIGLHNIPEGMAVSVPLIAGGMKKGRAVLLTALTGLPTVLGALIGYFLGLLSPVWLCLALSFASGAMLYVVFSELLPEAFLMWRSKAPGAMALLGTLVGLLLVNV